MLGTFPIRDDRGIDPFAAVHAAHDAATDFSAISNRRESVTLGTMRPRHRAQVSRSITADPMADRRCFMMAASPFFFPAGLSAGHCDHASASFAGVAGQIQVITVRSGRHHQEER